MKILSYTLRLFASIPFSFAISYALNYVALLTIYAVLTLVPAIIRGMFSFDYQEVIQDTYYNQLIPGWGTLCSIINNPGFSARVSAFVFTIALWAALAIIAYLVHLLSSIVIKESVVSFAVTVLIFASNIIYFGYTVFDGEAFLQMGIETGFWYYLTSIVILFILLVVYCMAASYLWEEKDNYKNI